MITEFYNKSVQDVGQLFFGSLEYYSRLALFRVIVQGSVWLLSRHHPLFTRRVGENLWKMVLYSLNFFYGVRHVFFEECAAEWFFETKSLWEGWPHKFRYHTMYQKYLVSYLHEMTFFFLESKTRDRLALLIHHAVTLVLLLTSWKFSFTRVGVSVMLLHDISDVLLSTAKLFDYLKVEILAEVMFVIFAAVFIITRLVIFPFTILRSVIFESCEGIIETAKWYDCMCYVYWWMFIIPLSILQMLHIFWAWKILQIAWKKVTSGVLADDRDM